MNAQIEQAEQTEQTEQEALRDALEIAVIETRKKLYEVRSHIAKLRVITNNRKPGDGYVAQEQLFRVIEDWEITEKRWQQQLDALRGLIEREFGKTE